MDPKPASGGGTEAALANQWEIQRRRRIWMVLVGWDTHMAAVLGRPTNVDAELAADPTLPVDAVMPLFPSATGGGHDYRTTTPVVPRSETEDPPTFLTKQLWIHRLMAPLREVLALEKYGPCPRDSFARVDALHQRMVEVEAAIPAWFRAANPDTTYDHLPEMYWLPYVRPQLPQLAAFNFMALHRPYVYTRRKSRTEALRACLGMLKAQRHHFSTLRPHQYKMFVFFFFFPLFLSLSLSLSLSFSSCRDNEY